MPKFDDVIGYAKEKATMTRICDTLTNTEKYAALGARAPKGLVLYGPPGVGKTLMAEAMISGLKRPSFVCRRDAGEADFMKKLRDVFRDAEEAAPSVILLDDLDKYSDAPPGRRDAPEFAAVQSLTDGLKDGVFVIATVNDMMRIPGSLFRPGRIEERLRIGCPSPSDAGEIVAHYLEDKNLSQGADPKEITAIMQGSSCAALESALNEAAVRSAFEGRKEIKREELVKTLLYRCHGIEVDAGRLTSKNIERNSYYIAGQTVAFWKNFGEPLAFATVCPSDRGIDGRGCIRQAGAVAEKTSWEDTYLRCESILAGNAAYRIKYGKANESCGGSISSSVGEISRSLGRKGVLGFEYLVLETERDRLTSQKISDRRLDKTAALVEEALKGAEKTLRENWEKVERTAEALRERLVLTQSDITAIMEI